MRIIAWIIGLMLLATAPTRLSAQYETIDERTPAYPQKMEADNAATPKAAPLQLSKNADRSEKDKKTNGLQSTATILASLALVLGIFLLIVWALRKTSPNLMGPLPTEAFEVLGRASLGFRQHAMMVRCGNKLLLISTGMAGTDPITEITDPAEVERLTELCRQTRPAGASALFRGIFRQKEGRHA